MKTSLCFVLLVVAAACGSNLTMEGARVKMIDSETGCNPISEVRGRASSKDKAMMMLRNQAGTMNANGVKVNDVVENDGQVELVGKAYSCPST